MNQSMPPSHLLMQIANDPSVENFRASFPILKEYAEGSASAAGMALQSCENILDFGCGVGRFLFAMQGHITRHQRLYGTDINKDCARWCAENIAFANIILAPPTPPLFYDENMFDFINAISVFTHMSLDVQFKWAWEIHRVLRPGGIIAMTTNGLSAMPFLLGLKGSVFPNQDMASIGNAGLFGYLSSSGDGSMEGQREIVSMYSPGALEEVFFPLKHVYYEPISKLAGGQALSIFQKVRSEKILSPERQVGSGFLFPGQKMASMFRFYLSVPETIYAFGASDIDYAIGDEHGGNLVVRNHPVGVSRVYAKNQYVPITIDLPPSERPFVVHIGRKPAPNAADFSVNFPHLIVKI